MGVIDGDGGGDEDRSMAVCQWASVMGMEVVMRIGRWLCVNGRQ